MNDYIRISKNVLIIANHRNKTFYVNTTGILTDKDKKALAITKARMLQVHYTETKKLHEMNH